MQMTDHTKEVLIVGMIDVTIAMVTGIGTMIDMVVVTGVDTVVVMALTMVEATAGEMCAYVTSSLSPLLWI